MTPREKELYDSLTPAEQAHGLARDKRGVLRFTQTLFPADRALVIKNAWECRSDKRMTEAAFWELYRKLGYSLTGYCEMKDSEK